MKKEFEYRIEMAYRDKIEDNMDERLNQLGHGGWELVSVAPCGKDNSYLSLWFKREL